MKIFPLLVIIYVSGIVMMRGADPSAYWTDGQLFWLNGGALSLAVLLFGNIAVQIVRRVPENYRVSALAVLAMCIYAGYTFSDTIIRNFNTLVGSNISVAAVMDDNGSAALSRHWDGHFRASTTVNGNGVDMLVDTGASLVLLTYEDGVAAGLDMDALNFDVPILTANGQSHVATILLKSVAIGDVRARNVRGAVAQPGQLHASLLGMSFIGEIQEAIIRKDRLILRN